MVRWSDGFYGGLLAAVTSAIFYIVVSLIARTAVGSFFAQVARGLPPLHGVADSTAIAIVGVILYVLMAIGFGILYSLLAARIRSMLSAPTSVMWGIFYGLFTWWIIANVFVPMLGAVNVLPGWEGPVGSILFYGVVLSEYMTVAYRRGLAEAASAG